ncbi:MAG: transcriptional regulator [Faecalibacterium prausnitzii]|nr:MAG: transcriptional regulator [Faecalibacterium prausnitzii]
MSGHSKWNNIKRKKEKTDGARAKVFTKIGREISVAVRDGGPNPASNSKLADLIAKAKRMSVPNDNIQRIIKKAEGGDKTEFEAITRTAADLRHYFDKNGGNLGAMGCVAFLFSQKGVIDISLEDKDADEAMMDALDAGAEDFDAGEEAAEITTDPENYSAVVKAMEEKGYEILSDDLAMVPMTTTRLTDPDQLKAMGKLLDSLEDNDDVQNVWHSLENEEDLPE